MLTSILIIAAASAAVPDKQLALGCALSQADKDRNASLSFQSFDQHDIEPKSWRGLSNAGCWRQALEAAQDYAIRGPVLEPYHQRIMLFHYGQSLAALGREQEAAAFIAFSREPKGSRPPENKLSWNDYVAGTWAFLSRNRPLLIAKRDAVLSSPGRGNEINGNILAGLERCFGKPYAIAYSNTSGCQPK
jgi:hypothetical protein